MKCDDSVVINHTTRLVNLEGIQGEHSKAIIELTAMLKEFTRMKYAMYGAIGVYLMQTIGLSEVLKRLIL